MKITFLGTRGYIEPSSRRHRMHTAALVAYRGARVMIDCGETWLGRLDEVRPHAVVITHPHPDHAFGLKEGAPCPVYATADAWDAMRTLPIAGGQRHALALRRRRRIRGIGFEPFPVVHSTRAPAVGYRVGAGRVAVFYVPDVVWIHDRDDAFRGIRLYIGDGASLRRPLVRKEKGTGKLIGHTTVATQLTWCQKSGVPRMIVTHCGSDIVARDGRRVRAELDALARERGVEARIAYDGMELVLR